MYGFSDLNIVASAGNMMVFSKCCQPQSVVLRWAIELKLQSVTDIKLSFFFFRVPSGVENKFDLT